MEGNVRGNVLDPKIMSDHFHHRIIFYPEVRNQRAQFLSSLGLFLGRNILRCLSIPVGI